MDLLEVRSLFNLATVLAIYPQAVPDEVVPFMVEEDSDWAEELVDGHNGLIVAQFFFLLSPVINCKIFLGKV